MLFFILSKQGDKATSTLFLKSLPWLSWQECSTSVVMTNNWMFFHFSHCVNKKGKLCAEQNTFGLSNNLFQFVMWQNHWQATLVEQLHRGSFPWLMTEPMSQANKLRDFETPNKIDKVQWNESPVRWRKGTMKEMAMAMRDNNNQTEKLTMLFFLRLLPHFLPGSLLQATSFFLLCIHLKMDFPSEDGFPSRISFLFMSSTGNSHPWHSNCEENVLLSSM